MPLVQASSTPRNVHPVGICVVVGPTFSRMSACLVFFFVNGSLLVLVSLPYHRSVSSAELRKTDPKDVTKIREAVAERKEACLCLLNYKKDGSTFHNQFFLTPMFDAEGTLVSF